MNQVTKDSYRAVDSFLEMFGGQIWHGLVTDQTWGKQEDVENTSQSNGLLKCEENCVIP